jgi:hypothetical protein
MTERAALKVANSNAEVYFHRGPRGEVVVERIINIDCGIPIQCTTVEGSPSMIWPEACATVIQSEQLKAA